MTARTLAIAATILLTPALTPITLLAQNRTAQTGSAARPPAEARQYDFLIGQWELIVTPKINSLAARIHGQPKLRGAWKAWRALDGWGVEDELRVVDESGNPRTLVHFVRLYDPARKAWVIAVADAYRQSITQSTAQMSADGMTSTAPGVDGDGKAITTRSRFTRVTPTTFRYQQDRSYDGGKTWEENIVVMDAKRTATAASR